MASPCRCGFSGPEAEHPCHYNGYTCRKPAKIRFYNAQMVSLAGVQLKFQMNDTWACDECWELFKAELAKARERKATP